MAFSDNLKQLPPVSHLSGLHLIDASGAVAATIDNKPGQAGSLAVYASLADASGVINAEAASRGLDLYAEHTGDARANPGKHPNIDRLITLIEQGGQWAVKLLPA
ncbi:DUF2322 family protein [Aquabacterium sp.]|uniref:DUF2322 family protein n=1 Tax=Aquabacterium sp. TaxID=1872578 RepID=UPI00248887F2|nr:DUF2322 family protein [Aquabacterium sp.]MDI1258962.1 DUF2322 family protein [Aquabacterium sp.]